MWAWNQNLSAGTSVLTAAETESDLDRGWLISPAGLFNTSFLVLLFMGYMRVLLFDILVHHGTRVLQQTVVQRSAV